MKPLSDIFWSKVEKTDTCWIFRGNGRGDGCGLYRHERRTQSAHRLTYAEVHGPIPPGVILDHRCYNRACVRPDHLRPVTNKQNGENRQGPTKANKSGVRGVHWHTGNRKWVASVRHQGRLVHVGHFDRIEDADAAVRAKRLELFTHNDSDRIAS